MDVEIITIGDEVVTGHTVDTNSAFIGRALTEIGLRVKYKTSVGDELDTMEEALRIGLKRAQVVITTGGLGPTDDDMTKRAIVKVFKRNLIFHEDVLEEIKERYRRRGIDMPAINQNQALLPQGARFFPNKYGSAVGICIAEEGRIFIALPGVPMEMRQLITDEVIPYLRSLKTGQTIKVIKLRTTGIIESALAEMITSKIKIDSSINLGYLPSPCGVDLRIIATGSNDADAEERATSLAGQLVETVGKYLYGREEDSLESVVGKLLVERNQKMCVAESCTGGQLGMAITTIPGSSAHFNGGVISYSNDVKVWQLGVEEDLLATAGAVSEPCALAMALGARKLFRCDYALSITGIAGPDGGSEEKPVGLVYIGLSSEKRTFARKFQFGSNREFNRSRAVYASLELLRREILGIV
jgi:nicotinamide-nucleotide amidase